MSESLNDRLEKGKVLVFGHRGMSEYYPENTMLSFAKCAENPEIDGIELDVHICKSGQLVIAHDSSLLRTAGLDLKIEDLTLEELSRIDVGSFKDPKFSDCRIPQLGDLFCVFGKRFIYDIELKSGKNVKKRELANKVLKLINDYGLQDNVMVSSFDPSLLAIFNRRVAKKSIPCADLFHRGNKYPKALWNGGGKFLSAAKLQKPHFSQVNQEYIEKYGDRPIITWTVNTRDDADRLLALNTQCTKVVGLIGNDPLMLAEAVKCCHKEN